MSYDPASDPNLPRRPVAPRIADRDHIARLPLPKVDRSAASATAFRASDVVPPEDNPLAGWRALGLGRFNSAIWREQGLHNPLVAYYSGRMRGHVAEDILGLLPWVLMTAVLTAAAMYPTFTRADFVAVLMGSVIVMPLVAFFSTLTCVSMHVRRAVRSLPLEELLLTRLRPLEIVVGLGVRPIAVQNVGMIIYIVAYYVICFLRFAGDGAVSGPVHIGTILIIGFMQSFLATAIVEFSASAALRCALFLRSPFVGWLRAMCDSLLMLLGLLVPVGILVLVCGGMGTSGHTAAVVAFFLILLAASPVHAWAQDYAWDPIYWAVRYHREWWVFQGTDALDGDAPERTFSSPWRPLDVRAGFASRHLRVEHLRGVTPPDPRKHVR